MDPSQNPSPAAGIVSAVAVPHPPLIVPTVGKGEESAIQSTIDAYKEAARRVAAAKPDAIVVSSPHAPLFRDGFFVSDAKRVHGDMGRFRAPHTTVDFPGDPVLANRIAELMEASGVPVAKESALEGRGLEAVGGDGIDHGTFVPLYFLMQELSGTPVVRLGLSGLGGDEHARLGRAVVRAAAEQGKRVAFVASGDLSHKLKEDGPYGFDPAGPVFDQEVGALFADGDLNGLFDMDERLCEDAAECGLRSFQIMAGALDEQSRANGGAGYESELLSLEGPFGVGYAVAAFEPNGADGEISAVPMDEVAAGSPEQSAADGGNPAPADADPYVGLARASVEGFVRDGLPIARPAGLPAELLDGRAGVFVSLHEGDDLRGCIGTIGATKDCIADEVIANAVSACSRDPRFPPVRADELDYLSYSVDVLGEPEPIGSPEQLDVQRYGVIVTQGWKRGLLLPNLDGVDTVEQQLAIAKQKAGISPFDEDVELERFEVVRHTRGGEARK